MNSDIELSQKGIKLSYRRFLADASSGYFFVFISILSWYYPILGTPIKIIFINFGNSHTIPTELKILLGLIIFLLATPIGFLLNSASWFLFGKIGLKTEWSLLNDKTQLLETRIHYCWEETLKVFNLNIDKHNPESEKSWFNTGQKLEDELSREDNIISFSLQYLIGGEILARTILMLSLFFFVLTFVLSNVFYSVNIKINTISIIMLSFWYITMLFTSWLYPKIALYCRIRVLYNYYCEYLKAINKKDNKADEILYTIRKYRKKMNE